MVALTALSGMLSARADYVDPKDVYQETIEVGFNGAKFEQLWRSDNVYAHPDYVMQAYGANDEFIIHNNWEGMIMFHDRNDFLPEKEMAVQARIGMGISHDDVGNYLVCLLRQNVPVQNRRPEFRIIKADGSKTVDITLPETLWPSSHTFNGNVIQYLGTSVGDFFSEEGGRFVFTAGKETVNEGLYVLQFRNGALVENESFRASYVKVGGGVEADVITFSAECHIHSWHAADGTVHYLFINRSENPIDMTLDEENHLFKGVVIDVERNMPDGYVRGQGNGCNMFSMGGRNYMVFPAVPNFLDGFHVAEVNVENGTFVHKAYHSNGYPNYGYTNGQYYAYEPNACNWLNGEVVNDSTAYIYQYFGWGYMAKYKFVDPIEVEDTPLEYIVNEGEVNNTYTIADDIIGIYIAEKEPKRLYAKDLGRHRYPSVKGADEVDYVKDLAKLQVPEWDQSNWVLLDFNTAEEAQKFLASSNSSKGVIKGGTLTGVLTNKLNPTMKVTSYEEPTQWTDYLENYYVTGNMMDPLVQTDNKGKHIFFVEPKPQEYVKVFWATYDGPDSFHFHAPDNQQGSNGHDLKGSFNVDWSLYPGDYLKDFIKGNTYNFHAIIRYTKPHHVAIEDGEEPSGAPRREGEEEVREGDYMVFPLEGGEGIVTAINEVTSDCFPVEVTYVNMMGMTSTTPFEGLNIVVTRYSNGSSLVTKEMRYNH